MDLSIIISIYITIIYLYIVNFNFNSSFLYIENANRLSYEFLEYTPSFKRFNFPIHVSYDRDFKNLSWFFISFNNNNSSNTPFSIISTVSSSVLF